MPSGRERISISPSSKTKIASRYRSGDPKASGRNSTPRDAQHAAATMRNPDRVRATGPAGVIKKKKADMPDGAVRVVADMVRASPGPVVADMVRAGLGPVVAD